MKLTPSRSSASGSSPAQPGRAGPSWSPAAAWPPSPWPRPASCPARAHAAVPRPASQAIAAPIATAPAPPIPVRPPAAAAHPTRRRAPSRRAAARSSGNAALDLVAWCGDFARPSVPKTNPLSVHRPVSATADIRPPSPNGRAQSVTIRIGPGLAPYRHTICATPARLKADAGTKIAFLPASSTWTRKAAVRR